MLTGTPRRILAILLGQLIDKILFVPLVIALVAVMDETSVAFSLTALALGTSCTLAGAYGGARFAGSRHFLVAISVAGITFALSFARFVSVQLGDDQSIHPLWWELVAWFMTFAAGYAGGWLARRSTLAAQGFEK